MLGEKKVDGEPGRWLHQQWSYSGHQAYPMDWFCFPFLWGMLLHVGFPVCM